VRNWIVFSPFFSSIFGLLFSSIFGLLLGSEAAERSVFSLEAVERRVFSPLFSPLFSP
jgi:hypothetical protein